ncbi:hypothetical protein JCM10049v2_004016 [Rhodotorula toruloides]
MGFPTLLKHGDDTEMAPGTIRLFDPDGSELHSAGDLILVPTPSSHPDDPLNWSRWRKLLSLFCIILYTFCMSVAQSALFSIYEPLSDATGISIAALNQGVGVQYLLVGFAPLITSSLGNAFGKRPLYLITLLISAGCCVWMANIKSRASWMVQCVVLGFSNGPTFAATEVSIAQVFFAHERATPMGAYVATLYGAALIAPLLGAYISEGLGYKAVFYFAGIFCLGSFIFCFFFMEETNFYRKTMSSTVERILDKGDEEAMDRQPADHGKVSLSMGEGHAKVSATSHVVEADIGKRSFVQRLGTRVNAQPWAAFKEGFVQPLVMLQHPIVWFAALQYGIMQVWYNFLNGISADTLAAQPYNFSVAQTGLAYLSPTALTTPGVVLYGLLSDRFTLWMAKRNGGISGPEHKLWLMLLLFPLLPVGLILLGIGPYFSLPWPAFVIAGLGLTSVASSFGTTSALNYLFDSFSAYENPSSLAPPEDCPQLVSALIPAMALSFAMNYALNPWIASMGTKDWGISCAALAVVVNLSMVPMILYGKRMRKRQAGMLYGVRL